MAMIQTAATDYPAAMVSTADHTTRLRNRISWGAVLAGVATALVVQMLLNMLGLGIGMATLDASGATSNPSASTASMTAAGWWIGSGIIASLIGGIAAGRLSGTSDNGTARWHGLISWCATTLCLMYLLTTAVGGVLGGTVNALGSTVGALGRGAATAVTGIASNTDGDALQAQARRLINPNDAQSAQDSVVAYIRASVSGDQAAADRARDRAGDAVARAANVSPDEARTRLQQAEQQVKQTAEQAKQAAQQAAETARKSVATAGFTGFIALVLGAVAAWFGGGFGAPRGYREV